MLALISPAKTLDYTSELPTDQHTQHRLLEQSEQLIEVCRQLSVTQVASLMSVSEKIAQLNVARFQDWTPEFDFSNARQALFAFKGDVYTGLDAYTLNNIEFAQQHVRMLSGLYGLLRPLDLIMPYRLEMGTKLNNHMGTNLYHFWGDQITDLINQDLKQTNSQILVNLASNEYYKAVNEKKINAEIVQPVFLDRKGDEYKTISFYAKKARGFMTRFIVENKLNTVEQLKDFNTEGYYFDSTNGKELIFKREN